MKEDVKKMYTLPGPIVKHEYLWSGTKFSLRAYGGDHVDIEKRVSLTPFFAEIPQEPVFLSIRQAKHLMLALDAAIDVLEEWRCVDEDKESIAREEAWRAKHYISPSLFFADSEGPVAEQSDDVTKKAEE